MTEQSNALRLAAQLEDTESARLHLLPYAAAELRRLHAENEKFRKHIEGQNKELDQLIPMAEKLEAQRDLLLRTLKDCEIALRTVAKDDDEFVLARHQIREVRAALKAVEEV